MNHGPCRQQSGGMRTYWPKEKHKLECKLRKFDPCVDEGKEIHLLLRLPLVQIELDQREPDCLLASYLPLFVMAIPAIQSRGGGAFGEGSGIKHERGSVTP